MAPEQEQAIAQDLEQTLAQVLALLRAQAPAPTPPGAHTLQAIAQQLQGFAQRQRHALGFADFPLPPGTGDAMSHYELFRDPDSGTTLYLNALRAGVDSAIHDHGTWAIIAALHGSECNRLYRPALEADGACQEDPPPQLAREVWVRPGEAPLILGPADWHSIHTTEPALQLHLYGQPLDQLPPRRAYERHSGRLVWLG